MSLVLLITAILILLFARVPVSFALLGPSLLYLATNDMSAGLATRQIIAGVNSFPLLAVPLFILLGTVANKAGIAERLFDAAMASMGRVRGALAYVNIGVNVGFSWMSGSSLADAAALGKIEVPAMVKRGYPRRFSAGLSAVTSLIAGVMPPSIPAIIYASIAMVSTSALFAASVIPAFVMIGSIVVMVWFWARKRPELKGDKFDRAKFKRATIRVIGPAITPIIILGGILGGFFTPTEAAAAGVAWVFILGFSYGTLKLRDMFAVFKEAATTTASVLLILGASTLLGWILAREQVPQDIAKALLSFTDNPFVFLVLVNVILVILGIFIETGPALVIAAPILLPVAESFGVDPLQFGVVMIMNLIIGLLTPPVGGVLFVISSVTKTSVQDVTMGVLPFFIPLFASVLIVTFIPALSLWLPGALGLL
jgi:tripartite ATP-independent transporter DctM subunit